MSNLASEIATALNRASAENGSNTPDFILAEYLLGCLRAFDLAVIGREKWYGRDHPDFARDKGLLAAQEPSRE